MIELCIIFLAFIAIVQTRARYRIHQDLEESTALLQAIIKIAEMDPDSLVIVQSQIRRNQNTLDGPYHE